MVLAKLCWNYNNICLFNWLHMKHKFAHDICIYIDITILHVAITKARLKHKHIIECREILFVVLVVIASKKSQTIL